MAAVAYLEQQLPRIWLQWGRCGWAACSTEPAEAKNAPSWVQVQLPSCGCGPGPPCAPGGWEQAGALPCWTQLQPFSHSCRPGPPCPHRLRGVCSHCLASPHSWHLLRSRNEVGAEPGCCHTQSGVCTLGAALTHASPLVPWPPKSTLWVLMSMGGRPRGCKGTTQRWPACTPQHESLGAMNGSRRQTGSWVEMGRSSVEPYLQTAEDLKPGSRLLVPWTEVGTCGAFSGRTHGLPWTNWMHFLPSKAHNSLGLSQTRGDSDLPAVERSCTLQVSSLLRAGKTTEQSAVERSYLLHGLLSAGSWTLTGTPCLWRRAT
nr:uncharacterized protein LOC112428943 isoform X1 [Macaca nemestrina]XP_024652440.1 uncharacterized protein LOC112428943 isoform X1 [Macaca nemestrina]